MKAILIDPTTRTIKEVDYDGEFKTIYELTSCDCITIARIPDTGDEIYLDDNGMTNSPDKLFAFKRSQGQPYAGKGLVVGHNEMGEDVEPTVTVDQLIEAVVFLDPEHSVLASSVIMATPPVFVPISDDEDLFEVMTRGRDFGKWLEDELNG